MEMGNVSKRQQPNQRVNLQHRSTHGSSMNSEESSHPEVDRSRPRNKDVNWFSEIGSLLDSIIHKRTKIENNTRQTRARVPGLGQAQNCGGVELVWWVPNPPLFSGQC